MIDESKNPIAQQHFTAHQDAVVQVQEACAIKESHDRRGVPSSVPDIVWYHFLFVFMFPSNKCISKNMGNIAYWPSRVDSTLEETSFQPVMVDPNTSHHIWFFPWNFELGTHSQV